MNERMQCSKDAVDFIDDAAILEMLDTARPDSGRVREILAKSLGKEALTPAETAVLLNVEDPGLREELVEAARTLKRTVYGNRIVLFAPLYIGNRCVNDCLYCAFRSSNTGAVRRTLSLDEVRQQTVALENTGHKRLILVFGEHRDYDARFIANAVRTVYETKTGNGEIRRVNINAAPLDHEGYKIVKDAGIGTYQIFQETYDHAAYARFHPRGTRKGDYAYRLDGLSRAMEAGLDDLGIGALFGLAADWRFDVLGLVTHARFLQQRFGVGPHTISFPRLQPAHGVSLDAGRIVGDDDFKRLVAVLRLAVPYTGMILTARESPRLRREIMAMGVSQIDAGSRIELGGYTEAGDAQCMAKEQFTLGDIRSLDEVMRELIDDGYVPSFCTACYRLGRTGEHFMEFAIPGFIKRYCTPNALTTLKEYMVDYASPETKRAGQHLLEEELEKLPAGKMKEDLENRLRRIEAEGERDLYY